MRLFGWPIIVSALLTGCQVAPSPGAAPVIHSEFTDQDRTRFSGTGSGGVRGQAFLRQRGGGVVTCAGEDVVLLPSVPYFREVIEEALARKQLSFAVGIANAYKSVVRRSTCDAQGNFAISDVPAGRWFVLTQVSWMVAARVQGGVVGREIDVDQSSQLVMLTDQDRLSF